MKLLVPSAAWISVPVFHRAGGGEQPADWENPLVFGIGKLPPRHPAWPHPHAASARQGSFTNSPWLKSLNGEWRFRWCSRLEDRALEFYRPDYDDAGWGGIPVPGCWELFGHGTPLYSNAAYPFQVDPPRVTATPPFGWTAEREPNPVGAYRLRFTAWGRVFDASAWPYGIEALESARHSHELRNADGITVNIDYGQMGVGGDTGWGNKPHEIYRLLAGREYRYGFDIGGFGND